MSPDEARRRFAAARVARLATADAAGTPHLVPITLAVDGDLVYTVVDAKPKRGRRLRRLANLDVNPRVALLVDHYDESWTRLWWVRADGRASIADRGAALERAIALLRDRYPQYRGEVDITGPAIVVHVERWVGWAARD